MRVCGLFAGSERAAAAHHRREGGGPEASSAQVPEQVDQQDQEGVPGGTAARHKQRGRAGPLLPLRGSGGGHAHVRQDHPPTQRIRFRQG